MHPLGIRGVRHSRSAALAGSWIATFFTAVATGQTTDPLITSWMRNTAGIHGQCPCCECTDRLGYPNCDHCLGLNDCVGTILADVQSVSYTMTDVYVQATGVPAYPIGPFPNSHGHNPQAPTDQQWVLRLPRSPSPAASGAETNLWIRSLSDPAKAGIIGSWVNGVAVFSPWDAHVYPTTADLASAYWHRNAVPVELEGFDAALGHPAEQPGSSGTCGYWVDHPPQSPTEPLAHGIYHHHQRSPSLSSVLHDLPEDAADPNHPMHHSPIVGWAFDGYPIYGPYGFLNADGTGGYRRMRSSYRLRSDVVTTGLRHWLAVYGPDTTDFDDGNQCVPGYFLEDYEYVAGLGDLDLHNGRCCVTPDFPGGTYAYFTTVEADGTNAFPYALGSSYYGYVVDGPNNDNLKQTVTIPPQAVPYAVGNSAFSTWVRAQKITAAPDGQANAHFGTDVALIGDQAFVGAPQEALPGRQPGDIFAFRNTASWNRVAVLDQPVIPGSDIRMGRTVAADPTEVITGDAQHAPSGGEFLFTGPSPWTLLTSPSLGGVAGDNYGCAVAIENGIAAVGASAGHYSGTVRGAVVMLRRIGGTWSLEQTLPGDTVGSSFGAAVAIDGGRVLVGSPGQNQAYLYEYAGTPPTGSWNRTATFTTIACAGDTKFGQAVAICGNRVVIGSPEPASGKGRAYVYVNSGGSWILENQITPSDAGTISRPAFGASAAICDDVVVVGAPQHTSIPSQAGVACVFQRCNGYWAESQVLQIGGGAADDGFARHVGINDNWIIVGADADDQLAPDAGAAYLYHRVVVSEGPIALPGLGDATNVFDIVEPTGSTATAFAAGSARRGGVDVPVLWAETASDTWSLIDLSNNQPLSGRVNRIGGPSGSLLAAGTIEGPDFLEHATVWQQTSGGSWGAITLAPPPGTVDSEVFSVLPGTSPVFYAVGEATTLASLSQPVLWVIAASDVLPGLTPANEGRANDVIVPSTGGLLIVGWARSAGGAQRPVYWQPGGSSYTITVLPPLPGATRGIARDILEDAIGQLTIAGEADVSGGITHAVLWTRDGATWDIHDLGVPGGANSATLRRCLTDLDLESTLSVGQATDAATGGNFALLSRFGCATTFDDLTSLVTPPGQWLLRDATAISTARRVAVQAVPASAPTGPVQAMILAPGAAATPTAGVTWSCGTGEWSTTFCWSGLLPSDAYPDRSDVDYVVTLPSTPSTSYTVTVNPASDSQIALDGSLNMLGSNTTLAVSAGKSLELSGAVMTRGVLIADGGSITADASSAPDFNDTWLEADRSGSTGGLIRLPIVTYTNTEPAGRQINANGTGSRIDLPNLTTCVGGTSFNASNGGSIDVPLLSTFDQRRFTAQYTNSVIHAPSMSVLSAGSQIWVVSTGRVITAPLTALNGTVGVPVEIRVEGPGMIGGGPADNIDLSHVTSVNHANIIANAGAHVALPQMTSYVGSSSTGFQANDADSVLDLSALVAVPSPSQAAGFSANNGGTIIASNVTTVVPGSSLALQSLGRGVGGVAARLRVESLAHLPPYCDIRVGDGGILLGPPFTDLSGTQIRIEGPNVAGTSDYIGLFDTRFVTTLDDARMVVSGGAKSFPAVTIYRNGPLDSDTEGFTVAGATTLSSILSLPAMTEFRSLPNHGAAELHAVGGNALLSAPLLNAMSGQITIEADGPGSVVDVGLIQMDVDGFISIVNNGEVRVRGNLSFAMTDLPRFRCNTGGTVTMLGGSLGHCVLLEVAARDGGPTPFQINRLRIGPGAVVRLVDNINNGNRNGPNGPSEALYVDTLEFADGGGRLIKNGLNVYYTTLIGSGGQILPGPRCPGDCPNDGNGDGAVDLSDLAGLLASFGLCVGNPAYNPMYDFNADGCVDLSDLAALLSRFGTVCP